MDGKTQNTKGRWERAWSEYESGDECQNLFSSHCHESCCVIVRLLLVNSAAVRKLQLVVEMTVNFYEMFLIQFEEIFI